MNKNKATVRTVYLTLSVPIILAALWSTQYIRVHSTSLTVTLDYLSDFRYTRIDRGLLWSQARILLLVVFRRPGKHPNSSSWLSIHSAPVVTLLGCFSDAVKKSISIQNYSEVVSKPSFWIDWANLRSLIILRPVCKCDLHQYLLIFYLTPSIDVIL